MGLPWWPIQVDVAIEPDGLRVRNDQAAPEFPSGTLLGWTRVKAGGVVRAVSDQGTDLRIGHRRVVLRIMPRHNRITLRSLHRARAAWLTNPANHFSITASTEGRRNAILLPVLLAGLAAVLSGVAVGTMLNPAQRMYEVVGDPIPDRSRLAVDALTGLWLIAGIGILIWSIVLVLKGWSGWWLRGIDDQRISIGRRGRTEVVAWSSVGAVSESYPFNHFKLSDGRRVLWAPSELIRAAAESRVPPRRPRLWTPLFVVTLTIGVLAPPLAVWFYAWLGFRPAGLDVGDMAFLGLIFLLFPGMQATGYLLDRRRALKPSASFPMNPERNS